MPKAIAALTEAELRAELDKVESAMEATRKALKPLQDKLQRQGERHEKLQDALAVLKKDDFAYVLANTSAYNQWQAMMPKQGYAGGYWRKTNEQAWKLMLRYKAEPQQDLIDFIDKWLQHAKYKVIEVFRHDLSERGHWLVERIGDEWVVYDSRSYTFKYVKPTQYEARFTDTVEMLKYMAAHHWYDGGPREDRWGDDD